MPFFRRKPSVVIEAIRWTGENFDEMKAFAGDRVWPEGDGRLRVRGWFGRARKGDWIVKGVVDGQFYPCSADLLESMYDEIKVIHDQEVAV